MNLSQHRDAEILEMLRFDRATGFRMLFDTYYMPLCLFAVRITDDFDVAEDIVQSLFVNFWERKIDKDIHNILYSYLFTSVRNNSLAYLKQKHPSVICLDENESNMESLLRDFMMMENERDELRLREEKLEEALKSLSPNEWKTLEEIVINEKSYKQVSADMAISINTLKTYLRRAMRKLREIDLCFFFF